MTSERLRVLYVSGAPRSGTTLLAMALGQLPGAIDVGELWALWRPAYRTGSQCGCGRAVPECPFWSTVAEEALGPDFAAAGAALGTLHQRVMGTTRAVRVWRHVTGGHRRPEYEAYGEALGRHYRAIAQVSGAKIVVDASKMTSDALLASDIPGIELWAVHLVRDPRGVAWSWRKEVTLPGAEGRQMDRHNAFAAATRWDLHNLFAEALLRPRLGSRFRRLRYEDFLVDPRGVLQGLVRWLGLHADAGDVIRDEPEPVNDRNGQSSALTGAVRARSEGGTHLARPSLVLAREAHTVWGNRVHASRRTVPLRLDEAWRTGQSRSDRMAVTLTTLPFLAAYGYLRRARTPTVHPESDGP